MHMLALTDTWFKQNPVWIQWFTELSSNGPLCGIDIKLKEDS